MQFVLIYTLLVYKVVWAVALAAIAESSCATLSLQQL
jgi:hypothetical protein